MKKSYKLQDLDCANCAAKMECDIAKLDGVEEARVNFMTQKLTLRADVEDFDALVEQAQKICSKYEPDCVIIR